MDFSIDLVRLILDFDFSEIAIEQNTKLFTDRGSNLAGTGHQCADDDDSFAGSRSQLGLTHR